MRSTEDILGWVAKERDYQQIIGKRGSRRSLKAEVEFIQTLLDEAKESCEVQGKPRVCTTALRRIAACCVRGLERYGVPDQESQLVHDCNVTIERVPRKRDVEH